MSLGESFDQGKEKSEFNPFIRRGKDWEGEEIVHKRNRVKR
jgi:hypothetical protein